eukprot:s804_g5.t1
MYGSVHVIIGATSNSSHCCELRPQRAMEGAKACCSLLSALQVEEEPPPGFETAVRVTQIFSGIFFAGLAIWLSFTNGTKLAFIQQASLEKRLTTCCFFGVYVGAVSAFFNFFQLTEVDDILLERPGNFVLDFSRPIDSQMH